MKVSFSNEKLNNKSKHTQTTKAMRSDAFKKYLETNAKMQSVAEIINENFKEISGDLVTIKSYGPSGHSEREKEKEQ